MTEREAVEYLNNLSWQLGSMGMENLSDKDGEKMREAIQVLQKERCDNAIWVPCKERLPEMHAETGILKNLVNQRSEEVIVTIKDKKYNAYTTCSKCELWDGKWHGDIFKWLDASKADYEVVAWMPLPKPHKEDE